MLDALKTISTPDTLRIDFLRGVSNGFVAVTGVFAASGVKKWSTLSPEQKQEILYGTKGGKTITRASKQ